MKSKKKWMLFFLVFILLIVVLAGAVGVSIFICDRHIKIKKYEVAVDGINNPVRLVVVADIHGKVYGEGNSQLFEKVAAQEPDAIVLLGDLFPAQYVESDSAYVVDLTQRMQGIAQVYFAMGNHETSYSNKYGRDWIEAVKSTGAIVFDENWADLELCGNTIRFGSSMGHGYYFGRTQEEMEASPEYKVLTSLEESPYPAILLAHMPDTVAFEEGRVFWHIPLVLSGHTHGGVIRIPGIGGLYAPMQGWWPPYDYGEIMLNDQMRMIITSGLSGHNKVPRIFNIPEICVVDLHY